MNYWFLWNSYLFALRLLNFLRIQCESASDTKYSPFSFITPYDSAPSWWGYSPSWSWGAIQVWWSFSIVLKKTNKFLRLSLPSIIRVIVSHNSMSSYDSSTSANPSLFRKSWTSLVSSKFRQSAGSYVNLTFSLPVSYTKSSTSMV